MNRQLEAKDLANSQENFSGDSLRVSLTGLQTSESNINLSTQIDLTSTRTEELINPPTLEQPTIIEPILPKQDSNESLHSENSKNPSQSPFSPGFAGSPSTPHSRLHPVPPTLSHIHFKLPTRKWTDPLLFIDIPIKDNLYETISKTFSSLPTNQRPQRAHLILEQVVDEREPYKLLFETNSWRLASQLARNDIISCHPTHIESLMKFWNLRWTALINLKCYEVIEKEIDRLKIDLKDYMYEDYQDIFPGKSGCMISFNLLLLINCLPSYKGMHYESIHRLYKMIYPVNIWDFRPTKEQHLKILLNIVGILVKISDLSLAIELLKSILKENSESLDIIALLGRLQLQLGDIEGARKAFSEVLDFYID